MSDMKTKPTDVSIDAFFETIENKGRREDAQVMLDLIEEVSGARAKMWGASIVGCGEYEYHRADGSEHKFMVTGFSPRKANMVVYLTSGAAQYADRLTVMGKFKHSVSCLYLPRLKTLDLDVLKSVIKDDIEKMKSLYKVTI